MTTIHNGWPEVAKPGSGPPTQPVAVAESPALAPPDAPADAVPTDDTPDPVNDAVTGADGAALLDDVEAFIRRFVAYPSEGARVAVTLWAAHTHLVQSAESSPRLAHLSPEPGSGKTRGLEVMESLVPNPVHAVNVSPAYLFRKVGDPAGPPTILFDEIDTVFGPKAKDNEDVRGLLNAGHRKGAVAGRCVVRGREIETEELPAFAAVALAGLGDLPDTVMSRSIVIRMRRRAPGEEVKPWRRREHAGEGHALRDRLATWAKAVGTSVEGAWPKMPEGVNDRAADVWEPLLAIADEAGGAWPERARVAAVTLVTAAAERPATLGVRLLTDLRLLFVRCNDEGAPVKPTTYSVEAMSTAEVIDRLCRLPESPWNDLRGKPIDGTRLARTLKSYGFGPKVIRIGAEVARGYSRADLHDPWTRYLPPLDAVPSGADGVTAVTAVAGRPEADADRDPASVAPVTAVTPEGRNGGDDAGTLFDGLEADEPERTAAPYTAKRTPPPAARAHRSPEPPDMDTVLARLEDVLGPVTVVSPGTSAPAAAADTSGPCARGCGRRTPNRYGAESTDVLCETCRADLAAKATK